MLLLCGRGQSVSDEGHEDWEVAIELVADVADLNALEDWPRLARRLRWTGNDRVATDDDRDGDNDPGWHRFQALLDPAARAAEPRWTKVAQLDPDFIIDRHREKEQRRGLPQMTNAELDHIFGLDEPDPHAALFGPQPIPTPVDLTSLRPPQPTTDFSTVPPAQPKFFPAFGLMGTADWPPHPNTPAYLNQLFCLIDQMHARPWEDWWASAGQSPNLFVEWSVQAERTKVRIRTTPKQITAVIDPHLRTDTSGRPIDPGPASAADDVQSLIDAIRRRFSLEPPPPTPA